MIASVLRWSSDRTVILVFDALGQRIPEYEGRWRDVRAKILRDATPSTRFEKMSQGQAIMPWTTKPATRGQRGSLTPRA